MANTINYTARLHSTTADKILAHVDELYDTTQSKFQSAINAEVKQRLDSVDGNIANKISGVYKVKGTKNTIAEVIALTPVIGDVWNVTSEFTLNGKKYPASTNVVAIAATQAEASWDALGGTIDVQDILNKAAADATTKANNAKSEAIQTASQDATTKANNAKQQAIEAAGTDATQKANTAKSEAISQAARDADTKVNAAKSELTALIGKSKVKTIRLDDLDSLITADNFAEFSKDPQNAVMVVMGHDTGSVDHPIGVLFNITDSMHHTCEQKFITHTVFKGGKTNSGHQHDILREWSRSFPLSGSLVSAIKPWSRDGKFLNADGIVQGYTNYEQADQSYLTKLGISAEDFPIHTGKYPAQKYTPWRCYHDEYLVHMAELDKAQDTNITTAKNAASTADSKASNAQNAANTADGKAVAAQSAATEADRKAVEAQGTATQAQNSISELARKVGAFDYSAFTALQAKVTELENLLKLA